MLSKTATEVKHVKRSVIIKEVNTQNFWTFDLGTPEGKNVPVWIVVAIQQRDRQDLQIFINDIFIDLQ